MSERIETCMRREIGRGEGVGGQRSELLSSDAVSLLKIGDHAVASQTPKPQRGPTNCAVTL